MTTDIAGMATAAETVIEDVMKVEPTVATILGMFVPGAAPVVATVQPIILAAAPYVERALKDLAAGNGGDIMGAFAELLSHLSKGMPNAPALSPYSTSASAQGSG